MTVVTLKYVEEQLKRVGCNFRFWGRPEIRELANILLPDEIISGCTNGRYEGGFALLCVTNLRLLLVDRKPMFLTLEDIRFDMIAEMDFSSRLLDSTIRVITPNRSLLFTAWNAHRLREILNYTQQRVMEIRQPHLMNQFQMSPKHHAHAPLVGGLAMLASAQHHVVLNPYTRVPLLMRRRTATKFY
ncbi:MAG TPA: PH domain-containing protein [Candidatus Pristimantibacillus sp.]|nr:PH domain-containing protein [Candidatus Pristimantibacillus sp.]